MGKEVKSTQRTGCIHSKRLKKSKCNNCGKELCSECAIEVVKFKPIRTNKLDEEDLQKKLVNLCPGCFFDTYYKSEPIKPRFFNPYTWDLRMRSYRATNPQETGVQENIMTIAAIIFLVVMIAIYSTSILGFLIGFTIFLRAIIWLVDYYDAVKYYKELVKKATKAAKLINET